MPSKMLLDLPDDLLLPILAHVPFTLEAVENLRSICQRFNNLTQSKAFYCEIARVQLSDTGALFARPNDNKTSHTGRLQHELDSSISGVMYGIEFTDPAIASTLQSVVKKGIALIWWLDHHAFESRTSTAAGDVLLDLVQKGQLDFPSLLTIMVAIVCMFESIPEPAKLDIVRFNRHNQFYSCLPKDAQDIKRLFLAFASAMMWTKQVRSYIPSESLQMYSRNGMQDTFGAMVDTSGLAALHMKNHLDNGASVSDPWTVFPALLKEKASTCQHLKEILGSDFDTLADIKLYHRIRNVMKGEALGRELLRCLDLDKIGRDTPLSGNTFEFHSLWYWRWNCKAPSQLRLAGT